jgi:hypothetical protein
MLSLLAPRIELVLLGETRAELLATTLRRVSARVVERGDDGNTSFYCTLRDVRCDNLVPQAEHSVALAAGSDVGAQHVMRRDAHLVRQMQMLLKC